MNAMLVIVPALALAAGGPETFTNREVPDDPYLPPPAEVAEPTLSLPIDRDRGLVGRIAGNIVPQRW